MKVDLHNHTILCNHATGTMQEYVEKAIENRIDVFGFSDHNPMLFDTKYRMRFEDQSAYERQVKSLKERYQNKIELLLAYEVDFLEGYMDDRVLKADVDYLIGSVHFIDEWGFDNPEFIGGYKEVDIDTIWEKYFKAIERMAQSGKFDIVGHLDLIKVFKFLPKKSIKIIAAPALKAIKKSNMVIEINASGFDKPIAESYPSHDLLELAFENEIPITFASDAHDPLQIGRYRGEIESLARSVGYTQCATYRNRDRKLVNF